MPEFGQHGLSISWRPGRATAMSHTPRNPVSVSGRLGTTIAVDEAPGVRFGRPTRQDASVPRTSAAVRNAALAAGTPA
jgi:hypothetical protein